MAWGTCMCGSSGMANTIHQHYYSVSRVGKINEQEAVASEEHAKEGQ